VRRGTSTSREVVHLSPQVVLNVNDVYENIETRYLVDPVHICLEDLLKRLETKMLLYQTCPELIKQLRLGVPERGLNPILRIDK
jgi:hypothetical protein